MKNKRKYVLATSAAMAALFLLATSASAIDLKPWNAFDLDNYTRLYRGGDPIALDEEQEIGDMSRAFLTFSGIGATSCGFPSVPCPQGGDSPEYWTGGVTDGTYLHGWEDNVVISAIVDQGPGGINLYFSHATNDPNSPLYWEFEVYQTNISKAELEFGAGFLVEGANDFDIIKTNIANPVRSDPFVRGRFAESVYNDPVAGLIPALAAINIPTPGEIGGAWNNQVNTPYNLGINAFVDIDPTWGIGSMFTENAYGAAVAWGSNPFFNTDPYDLAIQGVTLSTELGGGIPTPDGEEWIISDDEVRAGAINPVPEPATMLLLGTGLVGVAGAARRRSRKK